MSERDREPKIKIERDRERERDGKRERVIKKELDCEVKLRYLFS